MASCIVCKNPVKLMLDAEGNAVNYLIFKGVTFAWCAPCTKITYADQIGILLNGTKELKAAIENIYSGVRKAKGEGRLKFVGKNNAELQI